MASRPDPGRVAVPVAQRLHMRYSKHGRMRFASHRDFQRAFERALRRAEVPVAMSAGFSPHPRISYANSAPTGAASLAEYVEVALTRECDPEVVRQRVSDALPEGFDLVTVVVAADRDLPSRLHASVWRIELPGVAAQTASAAVQTFLAAEEVVVSRMMKDGIRRFDARGAVCALSVGDPEQGQTCAILSAVVRHQAPAVRPDDILTALREQGGLVPAAPPRVTRLAQGPLSADAQQVADPLVEVTG
ncbi:MAG: TIGR03936 family radical SAM-associated protein [Actinomycetales bacterium]|nr:TIGR03936 family radical SAM-associated protein [Actinomycetales bacterium]